MFLASYSSLADKLKAISGKRIGGPVLFPFFNPDATYACLECGSEVGWANEHNRPREFCSTKCQNVSAITSARRTDTIVARFGVENAFQSEELKKKIKRTLRKKYGVKDNISQSAEIQAKIRQTSIKTRGVEHHTKDPKVKARNVETCRKKYGTDNAFQNLEVQERCRRTVRSKYGVDNVLSSPIVQERVAKTLLLKYGVDNIFKDADYMKESYQKKWGVDHPMHVPAIFSKLSVSKSTDELRMFGVPLPVHGCEAAVLATLRKKIRYITVNAEEVPHVKYRNNGKLHYYYPDAMVETNEGETWVIEVKSTYWLSSQPRMNTCKFRAATRLCTKLGYVFKVAVLVCTDYGGLIYWFTNPTSYREIWNELKEHHPDLKTGLPKEPL